MEPQATPEISLWMPLLLSLIAGSATGLGGLLVVLAVPHPSDRTIASALAFAAGVMITVSVTDLWWPQARASLDDAVLATAWLLLGVLLSRLSRCIKIPEPEAVFSRFLVEDEKTRLPGVEGGAQSPRTNSAAARRVSAWRLGFLLAVVLSAHNLPEGLLVGVGSVKSPGLGATLCVAILIHNVAEGVVVAVPVVTGTGSRWQALLLTVLSGLSEPIGAALGVLALRNWLRAAAVESVINACLCTVGGVMVGVSVFELAPQAWTFALAARDTRSSRAVAWQLAAVAVAGSIVMLATTALV